MMNKFGKLRNIHKNLKYCELKEFLGTEIPLTIQSSELMLNEIKEILNLYFPVQIKRIIYENLQATIGKLGIIDLTFEIEHDIDYPNQTGFQILENNGWIDKTGEALDYQEGFEDDLGFFEEINDAVTENKHYLKIFAAAKKDTSWSKTKTYLVKQVLKKQNLVPKKEDSILVFKVEDMCCTNYHGIWLWKHFYL